MKRYIKSLDKLILLIGMLFSLGMVQACSDDEKEFVPEGDPMLEVTMNGKAVESVEFNSLGGNILITLKTNYPWTIAAADCADWVTLSNRSGDPAPADNPRYIRITVADLTSDNSRSGNIEIKAGALTKIITVTQKSFADSEKEGLSAIEVASKMVTGINIGNTLEVPLGSGGETAWGNPKINKEYIAGLKNLGFNAVRVPCAWYSYVIDSSTNTIDPKWLEHVDEIIGWILDNDMFAILNIHWDGGWLENNTINPYDEAINKKMHDYWTQIANKMNHHDWHLLFAGMNEPNVEDRLEGVGCANIIKYQQTFIDAVRATGGNNMKRCLVIQAPNTNIDYSVTDKYMKNLPLDKVPNKLFVEVHCYDPSDFTIMDKDGAWGANSVVKYFWGEANFVEGSNRNATSGDEAYLAAQFKKMGSNYVNHYIPVIVGEYSSGIRDAGEYQDKHEASRAYWNEVVTREARRNGCVPFYWETGGDINRADGSAKNKYAIDGIMRGVASSEYPF